MLPQPMVASSFSVTLGRVRLGDGDETRGLVHGEDLVKARINEVREDEGGSDRSVCLRQTWNEEKLETSEEIITDQSAHRVHNRHIALLSANRLPWAPEQTLLRLPPPCPYRRHARLACVYGTTTRCFPVCLFECKLIGSVRRCECVWRSSSRAA